MHAYSRQTQPGNTSTRTRARTRRAERRSLHKRPLLEFMHEGERSMRVGFCFEVSEAIDQVRHRVTPYQLRLIGGRTVSEVGDLGRLCFGIVAGVASAMPTDLAPPDGDKGARVAVRAAPRQDVAIGSLDDGKDMTGALVGHCDRSNSVPD